MHDCAFRGRRWSLRGGSESEREGRYLGMERSDEIVRWTNGWITSEVVL